MSVTETYLLGKIASKDLASLNVHRAREQWEICLDREDLHWLRVPVADDVDFMRLPLLGRWRSGESGGLIRLGRTVPEMRMPESEWSSIAKVIGVMAPEKTAPGMPPVPVGFGLVAESGMRDADALMGDWNDFSQWSERVLEQRVGCLRFALANDGRVFIAGSPLPAVAGAEYYRVGKLWLPCGYALPAFVWAEMVEEVIGVRGGTSAVLSGDGGHELIPDDGFIAGSRASIRVTSERRIS